MCPTMFTIGSYFSVGYGSPTGGCGSVVYSYAAFHKVTASLPYSNQNADINICSLFIKTFL